MPRLLIYYDNKEQNFKIEQNSDSNISLINFQYQQTGHKGPRGIKDQSPIFYLLELIKEVKIGISRNALLHCIDIFMKFSNMYTFFRFYRGKVCLSTYKVKASGQKIGLESNLASPTSIFKQVLEGLLNPSFNKRYMRLLSKKPQNIIYICCFLLPQDWK